MKIISLLATISLVSGANINRRLFGGEPTTTKKYPFFVYVKYSSRCGGTRYTHDIVLTAQHCAQDPPSNYKVYAKLKNFSDWFDYSYDKYSVLEIVNHPDYDRKYSLHNDVSVLKLDADSSDIRLIKLDREGHGLQRGEDLTVLGWSNNIDRETSKKVDYPRSLSLKVQRAQKCLFRTEQTGMWTPLAPKGSTDIYAPINLDEDKEAYKCVNYDHEKELCLSKDGDKIYEIGPGDSGSPVLHEEDGKAPILTGINSWSQNSVPESSGLSGAVRVRTYADWIDHNVEYLHRKYITPTRNWGPPRFFFSS